MSRYQVDKVLYEVAHGGSARGAFTADPSGYLTGRELEDGERAALVEKDYGKLYALGAHPYLLLAFARAVSGNRPNLVAEYIEAVTPLGYPDFAT